MHFVKPNLPLKLKNGFENVFNSKNSHSGYLALFIHKSFKFEKVDSLSFMRDLFEIIFIEIELPGGKNINVCVMCVRSNSDIQSFSQFYSDKFETSL